MYFHSTRLFLNHVIYLYIYEGSGVGKLILKLFLNEIGGAVVGLLSTGKGKITFAVAVILTNKCL